jgi:ABC-2 type transport system permease protein
MITLAIARNAFVESIRQPIFAVVVLAGMLALVFNVSLAAFTFEDDNKILVDLGLSSLFLCGLLLAAFTATSVLSREIDSRTVLTVVSKPVPRPAVVIGKYLGVAAALLVGYGTLAAMFLLSVRHRVAAGGEGSGLDGPVVVFGLAAVCLAVFVAAAANYLHGRPFTSVFAVAQGATALGALAAVWCLDRNWRPQHPAVDVNPQLLLGLALIGEAVLVLAAVAIAASTRLSQLLTLVVCSGVFLWGLVSEYFLGTVAADPAAGWRRWLAWPPYAALPNMQFFWPADALTQGQPIGLAHVAAVSLYAACLIVAFLSLAVLLFQDRDVG